MKIRLAINSNFVARKVRGAAYGILLLLTFFVPQFAKTQDQLNAAKAAQAAAIAVSALEQNQTAASFGKPGEKHTVIAAIKGTDPVTAPTNEPFMFVEEKHHMTDSVPAYAVSDAYVDSVASDTYLVTTENEPLQHAVGFFEPPVDLTQAQPVQIASLTPMVTSSRTMPALEPIGFSAATVDIEEIVHTADTTMAQPVQIASLTPTVLPAVQVAPVQQFDYNGEHITADLVEMPMVDFFRLMADIGGINLVLDPAIKGTVTIKVEKIPWDNVFDIILKNHGLDRKIEGSIVRVATKKTLQDEAKQEDDLRKASLLAGELDSKVVRLNYAKASELQPILKNQISPRGNTVIDSRTNSLVITDLPEFIDATFALIEILDIPERQVEIETRIVYATRNFARDIGIQFGFIQGIGQRVTAGGSNTTFLQNGSRPSAGTGSSGSGVSTGGNNSGNMNVNLPAPGPFGGIGIAVGNLIDTFGLDAAITAAESQGTAKMISQPKVVAQNNSPAVITSGSRIPVQTVSDNTVSVRYMDAALMLTVTPQITYSGNIVLGMQLTNNKLDTGYTAETGVPTIRTSEVSTLVEVRDGGTTLIAGINIEDEGESKDGVPGFSAIPVLGKLFQRTAKNRETQETLFFVTPRIIK